MDNPFREFLEQMEPDIVAREQAAFMRGKTEGILEAHALFRQLLIKILQEVYQDDKRTDDNQR